MPGIVYILCAATSLCCAVLLFRGYRRSGVRLLWWSGLCFVGMTIENVILYFDLFVVPSVDLSLARKIPGLAALMALLYGLVWDTK